MLGNCTCSDSDAHGLHGATSGAKLCHDLFQVRAGGVCGGLVFTGYPRTGDELYSANNVALTSPKMLGSLIHTDFPAIQHIGNQGEEHQEVVGGGGPRSRLSHDEPPPCAGGQ